MDSQLYGNSAFALKKDFVRKTNIKITLAVKSLAPCWRDICQEIKTNKYKIDSISGASIAMSGRSVQKVLVTCVNCPIVRELGRTLQHTVAM